MKKLISIFLLVAMLISVIPCVALSAAADGETITPDTSWYLTDGAVTDTTKTEYEITTPEQLLGFAQIIANSTFNNTFNGKTVKLGADIDLNPGWSADSYKTVADKPTNVWPAMTAGVDFAGTFDGQGHTISGVYQVNTSAEVGIFGRAWGNTATIQNLTILNSYSETNNAQAQGFLFGSVRGGGAVVTIKNVYVNARVVNTATAGNADGVGGLIGGMPWSNGGVNNVIIQNTVFAGSIEVATTTNFRVIGGLIGTANPYATTIENSASYATFKGEKGSALVLVGGIIGYQASVGVDVNVNNCISACTNEITGATYGSVLGAGRYNSTKTPPYAYVAGSDNVTASTVAAVGCAWVQGSTTDYYTSGEHYEGVCSKGITVTQDADISDNFATVLHGYQAKDAAGDTFDFRLVATVDVPENVTVDKVGFVITAKYGTTTLTKNYSTNTVYNSVTGNTDTGLKEYTAEALGGDYIFALAITGAPVLAEGAITLEVTTYYVSGGNTVYGATEVFTVTAPQDALN